MTNTVTNPRHPERICWGCERACPAGDLGCSNGTIRTPHPSELFGDDWLDWSLDAPATPARAAAATEPAPDEQDGAPSR